MRMRDPATLAQTLGKLSRIDGGTADYREIRVYLRFHDRPVVFFLPMNFRSPVENLSVTLVGLSLSGALVESAFATERVLIRSKNRS